MSKEISPPRKATIIQLIKKFSRILWKLYIIAFTIAHNIHILSQINPIYTFPSPFFKIIFNIILLSILRSSEWSLSFSFPHQNPVRTSPLPHTCHITHTSIYFIDSMIKVRKPHYAVPCFLLPLRPKCVPQYPILQHQQLI